MLTLIVKRVYLLSTHCYLNKEDFTKPVFFFRYFANILSSGKEDGNVKSQVNPRSTPMTGKGQVLI